MELLQELEVPMYIRKVKLSNKRRATYYELGKKNKLPKKYSDPKKFGYKSHKVGKGAKAFLTNLKTDARVIKNPKAAGTPKYKVINGQAIYSSDVVKEQRNKMMQEVKGFFVSYVETLERIKPEDFPIRIEVEVHYPYLGDSGMLWDGDNHFYVYQKAFQDVLTGHRDRNKVPRCKAIIPDDSTLFISKSPSPLHIPIPSVDDRKLVFKFYKEDDPRILNNQERIELFKREIVKYDKEYRPH